MSDLCWKISRQSNATQKNSEFMMDKKTTQQEKKKKTSQESNPISILCILFPFIFFVVCFLIYLQRMTNWMHDRKETKTIRFLILIYLPFLSLLIEIKTQTQHKYEIISLFFFVRELFLLSDFLKRIFKINFVWIFSTLAAIIFFFHFSTFF